MQHLLERAPAYCVVYSVYIKQIADMETPGLRFGQWFYNTYLRHSVDMTCTDEGMSALFWEKDNQRALQIVRKMYENYHWPLYPIES